MNNLSPITNDQFHTCSTSGIKSQFFTTPMRRVPRKPLTKMDVYWGLYGIHNFVLLYLSQIFVPCSGILFFNNHYLLVCMFKYCEHLHIISVIEILGYCFYSNNIRSNITKNRTAEASTADGE